MTRAEGFAAIALATAFATGCGRARDGESHSGGLSDVTVGGEVFYCRGDNEALPGVTVTLTDVDGESVTGTTAADGTWEIEGLHDGAYELTFSATGYETWSYATIIAQPEGSPSVLQVDSTCLEETLATVTIAPFGITLKNGTYATDEAGGLTIEYSRASNAPIVFTFDRELVSLPAFGGGAITPYLRDVEHQSTLYSTGDGSRVVYTLTDVDLDSLGGGAGIGTDGFFHQLVVPDLLQYDPLNGAPHTFQATLRFRAVP